LSNNEQIVYEKKEKPLNFDISFRHEIPLFLPNNIVHYSINFVLSYKFFLYIIGPCLQKTLKTRQKNLEDYLNNFEKGQKWVELAGLTISYSFSIFLRSSIQITEVYKVYTRETKKCCEKKIMKDSSRVARCATQKQRVDFFF